MSIISIFISILYLGKKFKKKISFISNDFEFQTDVYTFTI
jgi:hypothetical protein